MSKENKTYKYNKIAEAIVYIDANFKEQPSLDLIAE
jgi:AraC family transcriptional regulator, regulatory protein of adaptative response / methylated-DNA-[protein]-cysteine methyltransferase